MPKFRSALITLLLSGLAWQSAAASTYEVRRGDSLTSIAATQLGAASRWREIWALNPEIRKPEQLNVGMRLRIPETGEQVRAGAPAETPPMPRQQMSDTPRAEQLLAEEIIASGKANSVRARFRVLDANNSAIGVHAVRSEQDGVYVYSTPLGSRVLQNNLFDVYQPSAEAANTGAIELMHIGQAQLAMQGDGLAGFRMIASQERPLETALLLPHENRKLKFSPSIPARDANARITKALYEQPEGFVLMLDKGSSAGLQPGHLLRLHQRNPVEARGTAVEYPGQKTGWVMIVDTSASASIALVLSAHRVPAIGDRLH